MCYDSMMKQKQPPEVFCKKGVLRNFGKCTGMHLCQSLSFNEKERGDCFWMKLSEEKLYLDTVFFRCSKKSNLKKHLLLSTK